MTLVVCEKRKTFEIIDDVEEFKSRFEGHCQELAEFKFIPLEGLEGYEQVNILD